MTKEKKPTAPKNNDVGTDSPEGDMNQVELSEDMEVVSPGAMLREARKALSFSKEYIAKKLNFKISLVSNIEEDIFDPTMPVTFNRGYLTNYAKLVGVEVEDVLASYDALDAASIQRSEMLSFSKETSKQAEHSRVMWLSYLIVAALIGLTILWWLQENNQQENSAASGLINKIVSASSSNEQPEGEQEKIVDANLTLTATEGNSTVDNSLNTPNNTDIVTNKAEAQTTSPEAIVVNSTTLPNTSETSVEATTESEVQESELSTAVFTFNGDCWVNIFDATGERIAWGVKKSGYVMTIQGVPPLRITVGKPELTSIVFNGKPVDMSPFNIGNIAKFNLPIAAE